jgi:hypothetical protein
MARADRHTHNACGKRSCLRAGWHRLIEETRRARILAFFNGQGFRRLTAKVLKPLMRNMPQLQENSLEIEISRTLD